MASSLQQIHLKVFHQAHRGPRDLFRLLAWIVVLCLAVAIDSVAERPVSSAAGGWLAPLVTVALVTPFVWWTMHFLLAGQVRWRTLLPSAIITGVFFGGLGVFSKFCFSETIVADSKTYGAVGAIFGIMTWFIAIGAVILLGAVAGVVWEDRRNCRNRSQEQRLGRKAVQPVLPRSRRACVRLVVVVARPVGPPPADRWPASAWMKLTPAVLTSIGWAGRPGASAPPDARRLTRY